MPKYWMISSRNLADGGFGGDQDDLSFWTSDTPGLDTFQNWTPETHDSFKAKLIAVAGAFPSLAQVGNEEQKHVTFFVHGYNNGWQDAAKRYQTITDALFSGADGMGVCISFDWPSLGSVTDYLPDRSHAKACAPAFADVLVELYQWLLVKQDAATANPANACKAKVSVIAHSMGNYLTQLAFESAWTRTNQPQLASLINQLVMVAADVDNDLFEPSGDDATAGVALANLSYRITALYSGRDGVLGVSAGLKHFGTRRLGRSGLALTPPTDKDPTGKDNIWAVDCSSFFPPAVGGMDVHSAYFDPPNLVLPLIEDLLKGIDRTVLDTLGETVGHAWPAPAKK